MPLKVLVVDDSATDRMIIKNMLAEETVLTAGDGLEALDQLEKDPDVDLMILDLNMPNMDGFQVLERIKDDEALGRLRTVILTNYDELDNETRGLKMGAIDYIRKPIHVDSLKARIDVHFALIQAQNELEKQLHKSEESRTLMLTSLQGMAYRCRFDLDWTMEFVSAGCLELTGYAPERLLEKGGITFNEMISQEYRNLLRNEWERTLSLQLPFRYEYEIVTADGDLKWVLEIGQGIFTEEGRVEALEGIIIDISDRKSMENALRYNSEHDEWTDLYNRRYLEMILNNDGQLPLTEKRALISINLNAMHSLSVTYGFQYSQDLIRKIADELKALCHQHCLLFNTYEYRFVFYRTGYLDTDELDDFCKKALSLLNGLLNVERINVGIGVLEIKEENKSKVDLLMKNLLITSEEALHQGDEEYLVCFYNDILEEKIMRREILQREFSRLAVGEQEDRLFLQYQPVLDLRTNSISGFEALARYESEELGPASPLEFIPIIEESKHIIPIGRLILLKACQFINQLKEMGYGDILVSVNISAVQLLSRGFAEYLMEMIREMGTDPKQIHLELTESVFSSKFEEINRILKQLNEFGIKASIDDFGTGYSSLSRERELTISCLKIDKSFIDKLLTLHTDVTITSDIISMAHKLGHCVVAEGVEEKMQLDYLRAHDCDKAQGYLISRPLPEEKALAFLKEFNGSGD